MTSLAAQDSLSLRPDGTTRATAVGRDRAIDTMRGIAILMVIGIHSLQQPLTSWEIFADAPLRACVPVFLFASGYLTARSGKVPLVKRLMAAIIPYAIAFVAAYAYMALHNPAMDHRATTTLTRFVFAYAFVYYYVFVYVGCTIVLWLIFTAANLGAERTKRLLVLMLVLAIAIGLLAGSYLDPLLARFGATGALIEEARMRDIPFWFAFMALGALIGLSGRVSDLRPFTNLLLAATLLLLFVYAAVRRFGIGDAADYDSVAFFCYAALLSVLLLVLGMQSPAIAALGSGSYFIYLWHIFIIMTLRDHALLRQLGPAASSLLTFAITASGSAAALLAIRELAQPRLCRWLGA